MICTLQLPDLHVHVFKTTAVPSVTLTEKHAHHDVAAPL